MKHHNPNDLMVDTHHSGIHGDTMTHIQREGKAADEIQHESYLGRGDVERLNREDYLLTRAWAPDPPCWNDAYCLAITLFLNG